MNFTLDQIVREFLIESFGEEGLDKRYPRFLQIAISGLRDLNSKSTKRINWARLEVTDNDVAYLPDDYIKYTKIGVCEDGKLLHLGYAKGMCPPDTDKCGDISITQFDEEGDDNSYVVYSPVYSDYSERGEDLGRDFGSIGGGNTGGYYRVFPEEGYIALNGVDADEIVMEYHSDVRNVDGEHQVHYYDAEALKSWIWWKYIQRNRSYGRGDKMDAQREYQKLRKEARKLHKAMTAGEIIEAVRRGYRPAPGI